MSDLCKRLDPTSDGECGNSDNVVRLGLTFTQHQHGRVDSSVHPGQQAQQVVQERTLEQQRLENVLLIEEIRKLQGGASTESHPNQFLIKLTEDDDIETYLCTFERTALWEGWPRQKWASLQAPFLSGNAQKAYWDLNDEQAANYDGLKQ